MGSLNDPKSERTVTYTIIKVRDREIKVATDTHQPGADARKPEGTRVLLSVFEAASELKNRDARLK